MSAYYNEINPFAAAWLRELIKAGHIAPGEVDERSIVDVRPDDLRGFTQCHFFAGIGGFTLACRIAGWPDDKPISTGGFPCQDISVAGAGKGLSGAKSGLWFELHRCLRGLRPDVVLLENSSALVTRGLEVVVGDLASIGYDAEWDCVSAGEAGAPHERERIYILSYPNLQHGQAGLGVLPLRQETLRAANHRHRDSIWLEAACPPPSVVDGVPVHLVRRAATEGFGNAIVPQVAAEILKAYLTAEACK